MEQTTTSAATSTASTGTHLSVPHAQTHLSSQPKPSEVELAQVREQQIQIVEEEVGKLSRFNPTVTFNLDSQLDSELYSELSENGYSVAYQSSYQNISGEESTSHQVQIALPGTGTTSVRRTPTSSLHPLWSLMWT
jgi:hypothetical protein